jgi:hypothetical protein
MAEYSESEWLEAEHERITAEEEANAQARLDFMRENSTVPDTEPEPEPPDEVPATGATAGTPGTFTPEGSIPPPDLASCGSLTASPSTPWASGEYVVLGDATEATYSGTDFVGGRAP